MSTMKVGTDAMMLGSWVNPGATRSILDIGTGCGVLALMMAQVSKALIDAIDIHLPSVEEAALNVSRSNWAGRINVFCTPLEEHSLNAGKTYDLIITNPPFFINSLKPSSHRKLLAKHEHSLTLGSLLGCSLRLMHPESSLCVILPVKEGKMFSEIAVAQGLFPVRTLTVHPVLSKPAHRLLLEFRFHKPHTVISQKLIIHSSQNRYTEEYLTMTRDFHFFSEKST